MPVLLSIISNWLRHYGWLIDDIYYEAKQAAKKTFVGWIEFSYKGLLNIKPKIDHIAACMMYSLPRAVQGPLFRWRLCAAAGRQRSS